MTNVEQFSLDYFSKYCVENNIEYKIGCSSYHLSETFNVSEAQENDFWKNNLDMYAKKEKARPFASEIIKKLKKDGNDIYIITAREWTNRNDEIGSNMRSIVKKWLSDNDIIFDELIFSKKINKSKLQCCIDNKIDLMIEDSPENINQLSTTIPVICFSTNYNRNCNGNNIIRCYSWYDIYNTINKVLK